MTFDPAGFGGAVTPDGNPLQLFTLKNDTGFEVTFMDWGATWASCIVPLASGEKRETLMSFVTFEDQLGGSTYFGAAIGRYANRIAGATFESQGETFGISRNDGNNSLHGGTRGFDRHTWNVEETGGDTLIFTRRSPDGEEGFPGTVDVTLTWFLANDASLTATYEATTDRRTPVNLTNHAYFNLSGDQTILDHTLQIPADLWLPVDEACIPRGGLQDVAGTQFDLRKARVLRDEKGEALIYDHSFLLRADDKPVLKEAARLTSPSGDLTLVIATNKPAIQLYNGESLAGIARPDGGTAKSYASLALETHFLPDSPNRPDWPHESCFLEPGKTYRYQTVYRFER
jgi:aldose 1-epimerase